METSKSPPLYSPPRDPSAATVMLCPCLAFFLLALIIVSIALSVHFRLYCHTPLAHLVSPHRCPHHI
ncbi:hypothetical protein U9M48_043594 [Paspalum notatum var. saurae]|uniref:Uncharacterized protein n=1 Tax=Paspalum notatum var. saurae TaxID=547442 RepID=A0AAQ3UTT5_PASNO